MIAVNTDSVAATIKLFIDGISCNRSIKIYGILVVNNAINEVNNKTLISDKRNIIFFFNSKFDFF